MLRILFVACLLCLLSTVSNTPPVENKLTSTTGSEHVTIPHSYNSSNAVVPFAWQAAPPVKPIEERKDTNWWWWIAGVILLVGGGLLLYFLIKKDPRQDVQ